MIELDLHKSATFEKLIMASEGYNATIDKIMYMQFSDKVFALRAIVARHAYKDERIKPFVSIPFNLNSSLVRCSAEKSFGSKLFER